MNVQAIKRGRLGGIASMAKLSLEEKQARGRRTIIAYNASLSPEERRARFRVAARLGGKAAAAKLGPEKLRERGRTNITAYNESLSPEERSERSRRSVAVRWKHERARFRTVFLDVLSSLSPDDIRAKVVAMELGCQPARVRKMFRQLVAEGLLRRVDRCLYERIT